MYKFIAFVVILAAFSCNAPKIDNPEVSEQELFSTINYLSSDSLKGRRAGSPEGKLAAQYIADQFISLGYKPVGKDIFQYFEVVTSTKAGENNYLAVNDEVAVPGEDFAPFQYSSNDSAKAEVVFCGYGFNLNNDSIQWDDYTNIDVSGKWALVLRGDPEMDNPDSKYIPYSEERSKILTAKDLGAIGLLFVSGVSYDKKDALYQLERDQSMSDFGIPVFHITRPLANHILSNKGYTIEDLEQKLNNSKKPFSFPINSIVSGNAHVIYNKVNTQNVVAQLQGNDPKLKNEYIVIGAHYDHLGMGGPNSGSRTETEVGIHHGADDNASGVAALIEISEKLAAHHKELKRSVILIAFGAEEIGLLGSKYFTSHPLIALSQIKEMINIDMVGRLKPIKDLLVGGTGTSSVTEYLLDSLVAPYDLNLSFSPSGFGPSDHASFYAEDKPVFFFSTGAHADYHTPRDIVDSVNFAGLIQISDYIYDLTINLLNRDSNLVFKEAGPKARVKKTGRRSKVKLGIMPNFGQSDNKGMRVDAVTPNGPAFLGGMLKGDVIVAIEGKDIHNIYEYMERMSKLHFGQTVNVDVIRNNERKILIIQLQEMN